MIPSVKRYLPSCTQAVQKRWKLQQTWHVLPQTREASLPTFLHSSPHGNSALLYSPKRPELANGELARNYRVVDDQNGHLRPGYRLDDKGNRCGERGRKNKHENNIMISTTPSLLLQIHPMVWRNEAADSALQICLIENEMREVSSVLPVRT